MIKDVHRNDKYTKLFELMTYWQEFETCQCSNSLEQFSVWLHKKITREQRRSLDLAIEEGKDIELAPTTIELSESDADLDDDIVSGTDISEMNCTHALEFHRQIPLDSQISALITRLNRFAGFYAKKIFQDTEITSFSDFGILACIYALKTPKKIEVINFNLIEKTTGTEIMKRLLRAGFIEEFDDTCDKRSKRVVLTSRGKEMFETLRDKIADVSLIVCGNLTEKHKKDLAETLDYLNHFHINIYFNQNDASVQEIIERNIIHTVMKA